MFRPDHEYQCLLGIYEPLNKHFHPDYKFDSSFNAVSTTPSDVGGCVGCTSITNFILSPVKAILVARPFRSGGEAVVRHKVNGSYVVDTYQLYDATLEAPRLIWLPDDVSSIVFNIRVEDMGYEPSWYDQDSPITEDCDQDFINAIGLYFMYDANPYYSKLELVKEPDSQASSGRFLRDKLTTDLTFRAVDFDRLAAATEYAVCAVTFYERFEENQSQDYMAACCYFNRADAEINQSECYVKPTLKTLDNYSWLLDKYSVEKNIVGIQAETQKIKLVIPPVIQVYIYGSNTVTNICNDTTWEQEVSNPDISANELLKMGFKELKHQKIASEAPHMTTLGDYQLNLIHQPWYYPLGSYRNIIYKYNRSSNEYLFSGTTENYSTEPSNEWPYDILAFRLRNGKIELYELGTNRIMASSLYSGAWPIPNTPHFEIEDFITADGHDWWLEAFNGTGMGHTDVYVRVLHHDDTDSDRYTIGDFASLTKWYNKLAYPAYAAGSNSTYAEDELADKLMFSESNDYVGRPTEFGNYQPDLYYTNENLPSTSYISGLKPLPVAKSWWGDYSYWVDLVGSDVQSWLNTFNRYVNVNDCFKLDSVIRRLLNKYGLSFDFTATGTHSQLIYGIGGIFRLPAHLKLRYPFLIPSTNITRGRYTQAAQKAMLSLKDLLDEICGMCNAGWHIDKNGLHIEGNDWYDHGRSYVGIYYSPDFDFENVIDEFNNTNTLYGQLVSTPDTDKLWHTLSMDSDDNATRHFANTEIVAKAPFCKKDDTLSQKFAYDLLEAVAIPDSVDEDSIIMLGSDRTVLESHTSGGIVVLTPVEAVGIDATTLYEVKVGGVSSPVQARIMNRAFSWPYLKGRHMFSLPADKSLVDFGWLQSAEYLSTLAKAYTKPHRTIKIRMPIVSSLYTENWQLVKTTLGYGVISRVDIDLITRVATMTVDILEYNLP